MILQPKTEHKEIPSNSRSMVTDLGYKMSKADNRYQAYYRYLQSKWRDSKGIPPMMKDGQSKEDVYGNYTSDSEANFMTEGIRSLVTYELSPENKGDRLIEESRLRHNLLSSQPLCFNLFGELKLHLDKALIFFNLLYADYFKSIDEIKFEYNPARRDPRLTGDRSAFDVFVEYTSNTGKKGFIGIEVKYAENLREGADSVKSILENQFCNEPRTRRDRYQELSQGIFKPKCFAKLEERPQFQIWRDHLLAVAMTKAFPEKYDEGLFLFLSPFSNKKCREGLEAYLSILKESEMKEGLDSHFCHAWLEDYIHTLDKVFDDDWTKDMKIRYLGYE